MPEVFSNADLNQKNFLNVNKNTDIFQFEYLDENNKIQKIVKSEKASGYFSAEDLEHLLDSTETKNAISESICVISLDEHAMALRYRKETEDWELYEPEGWIVSINMRENKDGKFHLPSQGYNPYQELCEWIGNKFAITMASSNYNCDLSRFKSAYFDIINKNEAASSIYKESPKRVNTTILDKDSAKLMVLHNPEVVKQLLLDGKILDVNKLYQGQHQSTLLEAFIRLSDIDGISLLIKRGVLLNKPNESTKLTPLDYSIREGSLTVVHFLLEHNASLGEYGIKQIIDFLHKQNIDF